MIGPNKLATPVFPHTHDLTATVTWDESVESLSLERDRLKVAPRLGFTRVSFLTFSSDIWPGEVGEPGGKSGVDD